MKKNPFADLLLHGLIWFIFFLLSWGYSRDIWLPALGFYKTQNEILFFTIVYVLAFMVIPYSISILRIKFLDQKKGILFYCLTLALFCGGMAYFALLDRCFLLPHELSWEIEKAPFVARLPFLIALSFVIPLLDIKNQYYSQKEEQLELEKSKKEAELNMLKAQISPHFLFNSLNNLNSLIYANQQTASDYVVALSEILRYVIYEGKKDKVNLKDELKYLEKYVSLTTMKKQMTGKIHFTSSVVTDHKVEPLIFINFIENAIKHGNFSEPFDYVKIDLSSTTTQIKFTCENTFRLNKSNDIGSGIGLKNIRARLERLYGKQHILEIMESETIYKVKLVIQL